MRRRASVLFVLLVLGAALYATTIVPLSVEKLTGLSTHVVDATAMSSRAQWNTDHTLIFTYTRFSVQRALKGQAPGIVLVRQLGGTVDGITQKVAGVRQWRPGDEAVLFLRPSSVGDGAMVVTGLMQGNFLVRRASDGTKYVSNGMPRLRQFQAAGEIENTTAEDRLRLDDLEAQVKKASRQ